MSVDRDPQPLQRGARPGGLGVPRVRIDPCTTTTIAPISTGTLGDWLAQRQAVVVDIRPPQHFVDAHIPGSVCLPLCRRWAEWCQALLPSDRPLVLIAHEPRDIDAAVQLADGIEGTGFAARLDAGDSPGTPMDTWLCQGGEFDELPTIRISAMRQNLALGAQAAPPIVLDVRDSTEREMVRLEPSTHVPLGDLLGVISDLPTNQPIATLCRSGVRSVIAASIMRLRGFQAVAPIELGMDRWWGQYPNDPWLRVANA